MNGADLMNILFTIRFYPVYGGGETVTLRLAGKFADMGHNVHIFYLWDNGQQNLNSDIHIYKVSKIHLPVNGENIKRSDNHRIYKELKNYIEVNSIEVIINQWLDPYAVYKSANGNARVFNCRHAAIYINSKKRDIFKKVLGRYWYNKLLVCLYKPYVRYSDKFVLLCEEYVEEMKHIFHNRFDDKIISILNPCRFDIPLLEYVKPVKKNNICYVGRLYPEKQVDILLKAWKQVEDIALRDGWKFYIVGTGESLETLKGISYDLGCKNVFFEGYQIPVEYYIKSKIFVSASATEGYPMTLVEAMAYGCVPVIANTYSALGGILTDNKNGFKINSLEPDDFSGKLRLLMNNSVLLEEMKINANKFCYNNYRIDIIADRWISLFNKYYINKK